MSAQTTLTENAPMILNATCSFYRNWPSHATLRMDNRALVDPDIVADARFLPFRDGVFDMVYCDPPHMIRKDPMVMPHDIAIIKRRLSGRLSQGDLTRYGFFRSRDEWTDFVKATDAEFSRVLKQEGHLMLKLTFGADKRYIKREDIEEMRSFRIEQERITKSKKPHSKNQVHWLTMKPSEHAPSDSKTDAGTKGLSREIELHGGR